MGRISNGSTNRVLGAPAMHSVLCPTDSYKCNQGRRSVSGSTVARSQDTLELPNIKSTGISLNEWITKEEMHLSKHGMDAMFWMQKDMTQTTYINMLKEWNIFSYDEIDTWIANETFDIYN